MKKCAFCTRPADRREHLFSEWILEELEDIRGPINIKIGERKNVWQHTPEVKVDCVCDKCNSGWMSDLESKNEPHMRPMMQGHSILLEPSQQKRLAQWAILKTTVLDVVDRKRPPFYTKEERESLKPPLSSCLPGTTIWIGRLASTDIWSYRFFRFTSFPCLPTLESSVGHISPVDGTKVY